MADTHPEVRARQVAAWRRMSSVQKLEIVARLNAGVVALAVSDIRAHDPAISDVRLRHQLARRRHGAPLADAAFGHLLD